jgi:hypothetical protein
MVDIAQVASAVERMEARSRDVGQVPDVMQPRGSFKQSGVITQGGRQAPRSRGNSLDMRPATWQGNPQKVTGKAFGPGGGRCRVHAINATSRPRDVHGRRVPSQDVRAVP